MSARPKRRSNLRILIVGAVAAAVRIAAAMGIGRLPISRTPQYDALEYLLWAQRIAAGDFRWPPFPPHGPAYPFFLGALLFAGHGSLMFARIVQALLGAATCCLAGLTAARWFGTRTGIVAAALLALYGPLVWLDVSIASEGLLMFLLAAALWAGGRERSPILTGALIGLASLARPTALVFLPLLVWFGAPASSPAGTAASRRRERRDDAHPAGGTPALRRVQLAVAAVVVILPVTLANWSASHAFIPIQAFGGMNLYLGDSPLRDGTPSARPGGEWDRLEAEAARNGAADIAAEDSYFTRKTLREIGEHPGAFTQLLLRKTLLTFQNEEVRDTHSFYFFRQLVPILRWLPAFTLLFGFAVAGAVTADWRDRRVWAIAIYVALAAATCVALVVGARYRLPIVLGLAILGGAAAATQSRRRLAIAAAAGVLAALATRIVSIPSAHSFAEEWAVTAQSLMRESLLDDADAAARRAAELDPSNALAWDARGSIAATAGRTVEAADAFRRAIALNPQFAAAHQHLAMLLAGGGDVAGAAAEYRRVVTIDPRNAPALTALARLDGALGQPGEGLDAARRAAALETPDDDDWLIMAMLAADLRRFDEAEAALAHVPPSPRADQIRAAIAQARQ